MRSNNVEIGMVVRVSENVQDRHLKGRMGTVTQRYGNVNYAAFEVVLEDGRSELFWHYQLEELLGEYTQVG